VTSRRKPLQLRAVYLWHWIDETKRLLPLRVLRERGERLFASAIFKIATGVVFLLALLFVAVLGILNFRFGPNILYQLATEALLLGLWFGTIYVVTKSIQSLLAATLWWHVVIRALMICAAWWLWAYHLLPFMMSEVLSAYQYLGYLVVFGVWIGVAIIPVAVPILAAVVLSGLLIVSEAFIHRLAEYPKGLILGVSGLAGALAAVLKASL
jgi:hypothetical protein